MLIAEIACSFCAYYLTEIEKTTGMTKYGTIKKLPTMSRLLNENSISLQKSYGIYYSRERSAAQREIVLSQLDEKSHDDVG